MPSGADIVKTYKYGDPASPVAVLTLASDYEQFNLTGYAIIGSCFTENLGVQLVITDILKEPNIRYLIMCGNESLHLAGHAFAALHENGVARVGMYRKIIGCKSPLPYIDDIPEWAIDEYMDSIVLINMLGVQDDSAIQAKIDECIREYVQHPVVREAMYTDMSPVDEFTWKKYSAFQERAMLDLLRK